LRVSPVPEKESEKKLEVPHTKVGGVRIKACNATRIKNRELATDYFVGI